MSPLAPNGNRPTECYAEPQPVNGETLLQRIDMGRRSNKITYSNDELRHIREPNGRRSPSLEHSVVYNDIARTNLLPAFASPAAQPNDLYNAYRNSVQDRLTRHQHQGGNMTHNRFNSSQQQRPRRFTRDRNANERASNEEIQTIRLNINNDVELRKTENAWKPKFMLKQNQNNSSDEEILYRHVRAILNKLTAKNFDVMLKQFQELKIDTQIKLNGVINLIFEKAVNESSFSAGYAQLCKHLSNCSDKSGCADERTFFKRTFIAKCQTEFEQNVVQRHSVDAVLDPLNEQLKACKLENDEQKSSELKALIIEEEIKARRRLVNTVQFIGELFQLDMLTAKIMSWCIDTLIESRTDEKLECVCKLLKTVGAKLERKPNSDETRKTYLDLSNYMKKLKQIIDAKNAKQKLGTRIRFMVMDVLETRANKWVPRR